MGTRDVLLAPLPCGRRQGRGETSVSIPVGSQRSVVKGTFRNPRWSERFWSQGRRVSECLVREPFA